MMPATIEGPDIVYPWGMYFAAWLLVPMVLGIGVIVIVVKWALRKRDDG